MSENKNDTKSDFERFSGIRWYVVHTYTGYENKVKSSLEKLIENRNLSNDIVDIRIPLETTVDGEKTVESKLLPSYILVKMQMNSANWHVIRNITGVTGFVGPGSTPVPISDEEVERIGVITDSHTTALPYSVGDSVRITNGPLANFVGTVQTISEDMKKVSVLASVFGRETPVELDFDQLEPVK